MYFKNNQSRYIFNNIPNNYITRMSKNSQLPCTNRYHVFTHTIYLQLPCIHNYHVLTDTMYSRIPCIHHTMYSHIPCTHRYHVFTITTYSQLPCTYRSHVFTITIYSHMPCIHNYHVFTITMYSHLPCIHTYHIVEAVMHCKWNQLADKWLQVDDNDFERDNWSQRFNDPRGLDDRGRQEEVILYRRVRSYRG